MWPFKRPEKKREFNYAAIRIGNVYVLPPTEEDVREFEERMARERRQLMTRRAMMIGSAAAVIGLVAIPFLPRGKKLNPEDLLQPRIAEADPEFIRELALHFHKHPDVRIREAAVSLLYRFKDDPETHSTLSHVAQHDPVLSVRRNALLGLVTFNRPEMFEVIVTGYWADPGVRPNVDELIMVWGLDTLKNHIERRRP